MCFPCIRLQVGTSNEAVVIGVDLLKLLMHSLQAHCDNCEGCVIFSVANVIQVVPYSALCVDR